MIATLTAVTLTDTIETFFAGIDLRGADAAGTATTDLVIDELDHWRNPMDSVAAFSKPTFSQVAIGARQLPVGS